MASRADVEAAIADEERVLGEVARLLEARVPLAAWPDSSRRAFGHAVAEPTVAGPASWQRAALCRHLFGSAAAVPGAVAAIPTDAADVRAAERLRADLVGIVPLRAGVYLA